MNKIKYFLVIIVFILLASLKTFVLEEKKDYEDNYINNILSEMSLDEKIGQMLIIYNYSSSMNVELASEIENVKPGGFIVFSPNFTTFSDTKKLIGEINNLSSIPLFIASDEEGGTVRRLKGLKDVSVTNVPSMRKLGNTNNENLAYEVGRILGSEASTLGINTIFGPVLDVGDKASSLKTRIISSDVSIVKRLGVKIGEGIESLNLISVYKHFPGLGNSEIDSHYDLPIINSTKDELYDVELVPFIEASKTADMIMIGHAAYPNITGSFVSASLSSVIINDILRKELGFDGVVVTDALNMKALTKLYTDYEIYEMAINAGVDILLMPKNGIEAVKIIKELVENNKITVDRIDESVRRILKLKYFKLDKFKMLDYDILGSSENKKIIEQINNSN